MVKITRSWIFLGFDAELTFKIKILAPARHRVMSDSNQPSENYDFFVISEFGPNLALEFGSCDLCNSKYLWRVFVWEQI